MSAIIAFFVENSKYILGSFKWIGVFMATLIGLFFLKKCDSLKAQNEALNQTLENEDKIVRVQNAIIKTAEDNIPTDSNGIINSMRQDKL